MSVDIWSHQSEGSVAQMVEHSLCMRGAGGSIPPTSIVLFVFSYLIWNGTLYSARIINKVKVSSVSKEGIEAKVVKQSHRLVIEVGI